jgi:hypothetical protein
MDGGDGMSTDLPLQLFGIRAGKGYRIHLYDTEGDRLSTLCGRVIGINPRWLAPEFSASSGGESPDRADCGKCRRIAMDPSVYPYSLEVKA